MLELHLLPSFSLAALMAKDSPRCPLKNLHLWTRLPLCPNPSNSGFNLFRSAHPNHCCVSFSLFQFSSQMFLFIWVRHPLSWFSLTSWFSWSSIYFHTLRFTISADTWRRVTINLEKNIRYKLLLLILLWRFYSILQIITPFYWYFMQWWWWRCLQIEAYWKLIMNVMLL